MRALHLRKTAACAYLAPHTTFPYRTQAVEKGQRILIDLSFADKMSDVELRSLCQQLAYCYHANSRAADPVHLILTGAEVREWGEYWPGVDGRAGLPDADVVSAHGRGRLLTRTAAALCAPYVPTLDYPFPAPAGAHEGHDREAVRRLGQLDRHLERAGVH